MHKQNWASFLYIIHKNQLKMVHILKHRVENRKFLEENTGGTFLTQEFDNDLGSDFLDSTTKAKTTKQN